jgi:hypothetical protein
MDERDRDWRDRDWRRSEDLNRGARREARRWDEDRSWREDDARRGAFPEDEGDYGRAYRDARNRQSGGGDLTTGGAYGRDPLGARTRYGGQPPRFDSQDYTARDTGYDLRSQRGSRYGRDERDYAARSYAADRPGQDWESDRETAWARYSPEDDRQDERREERREDRREAWRGREDDQSEGGGDFLTRAGERISSWFRGSDLMRGSREDGEPRRYREDFGREARPIPSGEHRGRGPRGYKRSDERISDEVHDRLTDDPWLDASNIDVEVKSGEVTLSGKVDNREAKHRAERLVEDISGVGHVQNNLRVDPAASLTGAGRGYGSSALEAEMRREARETDPGNNGASGRSGRTSTGALAQRSTDESGQI